MKSELKSMFEVVNANCIWIVIIVGTKTETETGREMEARAEMERCGKIRGNDFTYLLY